MHKPQSTSPVLHEPARRPGYKHEGHKRKALSLRAAAFRAVKSPLLGRYFVDWRWPRTADLGAWEKVVIPSRSGAQLAGLYGASVGERKGVVVCAHPLTRNAKGYFLSSGRADLLRRNGHDVLLFDFNGFGESSHGDFNYVQDVLAAAQYARGRARGLPIHALAVCFGAVWTLCAAAREQSFDAIVVEAPLTSLHEYYAEDRLAGTFLRVLCRMFPKIAASAAPLEAAGKFAGTPRLLVIAGLDDTTTPMEMSRRLFEACTLPRPARSIWYVEGASHMRAFEAAPREYEARLTDFFSGSIAASVR